ncbi:MAG: methylated-DNA--[protein]-cysteine S-methyltransferase [Acidimicrobiales bacterium]
MTLTSTATVTTTVDSPIGPLTLTASDGFLTGLSMHEQRHAPRVSAEWVRDDAWFAPVTEQLDAYFSGDLTDFDVQLRMEGTEFQRQVWAGLRGIPYGATLSYGELARRVGRPGASRAVGLANGRNPIAIVVPCHRVIGSDGQLTGYGGGIDRKIWLLDLEQAAYQNPK